MKKVLIADDESLSRETLCNYIPWDNYGCEVIASCENGKIAYDIACSKKPDIIIADIKMPKMNGIELLELLKPKLPNSVFIIISAYPEKKYFKNAIDLKVSAFIEKPFDMDNIHSTISSVILDCDKKNQLSNSNKIILAQNILNQNFMKNATNEQLNEVFSNYNKATNYTQFFSSHTNYLSLIVSVLPLSPSIDIDNLTIINDFENYLLSNSIFSISVTHNENQIMTVINFDSYNYNNILHISNNYIIQAKNTHPTAVIGIALGTIKQSFVECIHSLSLAQQSYKKFFFRNYNEVIPYEDTTTTTINELELSDIYLYINEIIYNIKHNNDLNAFVSLDNFIAKLKTYENSSSDEIKNILLNLVTLFNNLCNDLNILDYKEDLNNYSLAIAKSNSLNKIKFLIRSIIKTLLTKIQEKYSNTTMIDEILIFIENNLSNYNLSIKYLSDNFFISQSYLCSIFKKTTGYTINDYITIKRISLDRDLLNNSSLNICNIAKKVGYTDAKYFSKVFKKTYGLSQKELREHGLSKKNE